MMSYRCIHGRFMDNEDKRRDVDSFTILMKNTAPNYEEWWNQQLSGLDRHRSPWQLLHIIHIMFRFKVFWTQTIILEEGTWVYDEVKHSCRPTMLPSLTSCFPRDFTIWPMHTMTLWEDSILSPRHTIHTGIDSTCTWCRNLPWRTWNVLIQNILTSIRTANKHDFCSLVFFGWSKKSKTGMWWE
jgi:hypothetical protein